MRKTLQTVCISGHIKRGYQPNQPNANTFCIHKTDVKDDILLNVIWCLLRCVVSNKWLKCNLLQIVDFGVPQFFFFRICIWLDDWMHIWSKFEFLESSFINKTWENKINDSSDNNKILWKMPIVVRGSRFWLDWNCKQKLFRSTLFTLLEMVQFSNLQACDDYHILCYYLSNLVVLLVIKPTNLSHLSFSYGLSFSQHWNTSNQEKLVILWPVHQDKFVESPWNHRKSGSPLAQLQASGSGTPVITAPLLADTSTRRQTHRNIYEQFQMTFHAND